jgi:hypothetical protein
MGLRGRWLPCVGLMLLFAAPAQAQERSPLFEAAHPKAVMGPSLASNPIAAQASGPKSGRRDSLINGTLIGAAIGAVTGMALVYWTSDSEGADQYAYGALAFGGIGAGVGLGVDALLNRGPGVAVGTPRRIAVKTKVSRKASGVHVTMRW